MFESLLGLLTAWTRQKTGRLVSVWLFGVTMVPEVTRVAAVTAVFPSEVKESRAPQSTRGVRPESRPARAGTGKVKARAAARAAGARAGRSDSRRMGILRQEERWRR